jgi:predicted methyltransferase
MDSLSEVAEAAHVREGPEAVRRIVVGVFRAGRLSTKKVARRAYLPVPVAAAVLRELGKRGLIARDRGARLTPSGVEYATNVLGLGRGWDVVCPHCAGRRVVIGPELQPLLADMQRLAAARPPVDWTLDQSHATAATALRRALLLHENGDLDGRRIIFLGDDDLTSLASALLLRQGGRGDPKATGGPQQLTVLECDRRLVELLNQGVERLGVAHRIEAFDLLWDLPVWARNAHDVAVCDPPYTPAGLQLFVSRAIEGLEPERGKRIYLCYPRKSPEEALAAQKWLAQHRLLVREIIRGFNRYHGASILANQSDMMILETTAETRADPAAGTESRIYTYSNRQQQSHYVCRGCGARFEVGPQRTHVTVQDLKKAGCPECGGRRFDRTARRTVGREENRLSSTGT